MSVRRGLLGDSGPVRWLVLAAAISAAPAGAAEAPVPVEAFVRDGLFTRPALSPDGTLMAVIVDRPDGDQVVPTLVVYEVPKLKVVSVLRMPVRQVAIEHHWVDNRRLVMSNGVLVGRHDAPLASGSIFATDIDGKHQRHLYGSAWSRSESGNGQVHIRPGLPNGHFYLSDSTRLDQGWGSALFDVDSMTGVRKQITVAPLPGLSFLLQSDGIPRYAFGSDTDNRWVLYSREAQVGSWTNVPLTANTGRFVPLVFTPDSRAIFASFSADGGPESLVRQRVETSERETLAQHEVGSIDVMMFGPGPARQPFAVASKVGVPRLQYLAADLPEAQLHRALAAQFPGMFVDFLSYSADGQRLLFSVSSDRDPGAYYLWDQRTMKAHLLFSNMGGIDPSRMGERRPIRYKARDGVELHGYLTLPQGREANKLPLVLLPHGGPHFVADNWFFDEDAQFLASRGYAVLQVNFRGSSGRGQIFRRAGFRHWGDEILDDLIDGVKWAIDTGVADASRVCSFGASFGAYASMMTVIRAPGLFKCAVGQAGLYDLPMWFQSSRFLEHRQLQRALAEFIGAEEQEQARISPTRLAEGINVPVLLVHGSVDSTARLEQGEAMRNALAKANKPHEWVEVAGEGHGFYTQKNQIDFYRRLEVFLAKHIGK